MSEFKNVAKLVNDKLFDLQNQGNLFRSSINGDELWDVYLSNFKDGDNLVFRDPKSSSHNCNLDKNFIRRYGNIVSINEDNSINTIWNVLLSENNKYYKPFNAMVELINNSVISDVFVETFDMLNSLPYEKTTKSQEEYKLGFVENHKIYTQEEADKFGVVTAGKVYKFYHFYGTLLKSNVDFSGKTVESIMNDYRTAKEVFKRGLDEISLDTLLLVKDLINQGSLLDAESQLYKIEEFIKFKNEYDKLTEKEKDNWSWVNSYDLGIARFRNELIGVLCTDLTQGVEINKACCDWNKRVDPINYMRATKPITEQQKRDAQKFIEENGYLESFERRFATIDDINVDEIKHSNIGDEKSATIFDKITPTTSSQHKKSEFDKVEEVHIDKFLKDILSTCTSVEVFLENRLESNLVALTTSKNINSKKMFAWNNNFSWTFNGNLSGKSQIKNLVKSRGGKTDADVRVSLSFPNTSDDYDLHLREPCGYKIYYSNIRRKSNMGGILDLDAQGVDGYYPPEGRVENITYENLSTMSDGTYEIWVNNFSSRGLNTTFQLEVEINDEITLLESKPNNSNNISCCDIIKEENNITLKVNDKDMNIIESNILSKKMWILDSNKFHKVNLISTTPNHWGDNNVGNKYYLFMLDNCKTDSSLVSFHPDNLNSELKPHRKIVQVLSQVTMLEPDNNKKQLAGVGFNATVRDYVILKLQGSFKRIIKVSF